MWFKPGDFRANHVTAILGRRGCGKSTLSKNIQNVYPRRFIFDVVNDYPHVAHKIQEFQQLKNYLPVLKSAKHFEIVFQAPPFQDRKKRTLVFDHVLRVLFTVKNLTVVIGEVQTFSHSHMMTEGFEDTLMMGRHANVSMIIDTQRTANMHKDIVGMCDHIFMGQMHEKNDIIYLADSTGVAKEILPQLPVGDFMWWRPGGHDIVKITTQIEPQKKSA